MMDYGMEQSLARSVSNGPGYAGRPLGEVRPANGRAQGPSIIEEATAAFGELAARIRNVEMQLGERHLEAFGPFDAPPGLKDVAVATDRVQVPGRERLQASLRGAYDAVTRLEHIAASLVAQI